MQTRRIFLFIFILSITLSAAAKERTAPADSLKRGISWEVSADLAGAVQRAVSSYGQYEAAIRMNFKDRFYPIVEIGYGSADNEDDATGIRYKASAPYGRIGCDFNMLRDKHDIYRLYVGARYAYTSFSYDLSHPSPLVDPTWGGNAAYEVKDVDCHYHWLEAVAGVQALIFKPVSLGWTVRYRARINQGFNDPGEPWYVPGFGKRGKSRIGFTFNLIVKI